jgi:hypothetical protein
MDLIVLGELETYLIKDSQHQQRTMDYLSL